MGGFFRPSGACVVVLLPTHGLRRGLYSYAAPRLVFGGYPGWRPKPGQEPGPHAVVLLPTHGLRRGLYSYAAPRLVFGGYPGWRPKPGREPGPHGGNPRWAASFAPSGAGSLFSLVPTAGAVGCVLAPLRGFIGGGGYEQFPDAATRQTELLSRVSVPKPGREPGPPAGENSLMGRVKSTRVGILRLRESFTS